MRVLLLTCVVGACLVAAGTLFEHEQARQASHRFPPAGRLVDIGGRRLQLDCRGRGTPTVVFEAGLDINGSLSWSLVHDAIAKTTRACAYSRAGIMWSDRRPGSVTAQTIVRDLHDLLMDGGEHAPFVMVGHSLGGDYVVAYTDTFQSDVAGVVLVDASHPETRERLQALLPGIGQSTPRWYRAKVALGWTGVMRFDRDARMGVPHQPTEDLDAIAAYAPSSTAAMLHEEDAMPHTFATVARSHDLGSRPTIVLTAAGSLPDQMLAANGLTAAQGRQVQQMWHQLQAEEATWSSRSTQESVSDAGHYLQFDRPDAVITAVQAVVATVRATPQ
jgi:pimeloyl-ACP methyl ester carboxylesterase